ncbi:cache domain-containing sensor histidine kinase [Paenibacillus chibensis]|uniref:cache domain-containing sensor histidine kinase n=1 Tax=Paenibacillus chibensis TaxID=59846 RepID=UPI000FD76FE0|nr:sensor histidine kinase [Paenibacillus chibensis]MEC0372283.1 histidine kinase [Paenibacillus chibensis]
MKKMFQRQWFSPQTSIQGKIFIAFALVTFLSIASITGIVYMNMRETIKHNAVTSVSNSIRQADESLNIMLEEIDRLNAVVVTNKNTVIDTIMSPNEEPSYEWFQEQKRMTEFLSALTNYKPYISRIAVVGLNGKVFFTGGPWLDRSVLGTSVLNYMLRNGSRHAYFKAEGSSETLTVGREIRYNRESVGVVMVDLDYEFIKKTYGVKPTTDSMLYVLDEQDGYVYQSESEASPDALPLNMVVQIKQSMKGRNDAVEQTIHGRSYIVVSRYFEYTGWSTIALVPLDSLLTESTRIRNLLAEVSIIVFIVILIVSHQISSRTTLNIRRLKSMMSRVKDGNLSFPKTEIKTKDEVGQLYQVFIGMVEELKSLLEGIRMTEKKKREAELTALQAQVRPHFLYNSLNTIKYLAKLNGVPNIEEVSGSLIELMRGLLGNSNEFLTLQEELDYVNSYVSIVKYKYLEPIQVLTQIEDESLLQCKVLKLMLQPLVENAIMHGIGPTENGGQVLIRVYAEDQDVLIEVIDNGKGIAQEQVAELLGSLERDDASSRFSSMGIRNAHERIVRMFGEPYGLSLHSELGLYTKVEIRFPKIQHAESSAQEVI